jgi:hypothetical protein
VAKWLELAAKAPAADLTRLVTTGTTTAAQEILNMIRDINDDIQQNEQRWGLRPHKVSVFSAYDFTTGRLKGLTAGAGYRWRSPNVIGRYANGSEIEGRALTGVDAMLRYAHKISARSLPRHADLPAQRLERLRSAWHHPAALLLDA